MNEEFYFKEVKIKSYDDKNKIIIFNFENKTIKGKFIKFTKDKKSFVIRKLNDF